MGRSSTEGRRWLKWRLRTVFIVGALVAGLVYLVPIAATSTNIRHFPTFNGTDIIDGSLTGRDIRNKSLSPSDFRGSIRGARGAPGQTGPPGQTGAQGVQGVPGFSLLNYVTTGDIPNPAGGLTGGSSICPSGQYPIGGGASTSSGGQVLNESRPDRTANGWIVYVLNEGTGGATFRVFVVCAPSANVTGGTRPGEGPEKG